MKCRGYVIGGSAGIVLVLAWAGLYRLGEPPVEKMEEVRNLLSDAREAGAKVYCPQLYREAEVLYDSARICWKAENRQLIFFRHYGKMRSLVEKAGKKGNEAVEQALLVKREFREALKEDITCLREEMAGFERYFLQLPLASSGRKRYTEGKLLLNHAEVAFSKGDYVAGARKYGQAAPKIRDTYAEGRKMLDDYFVHLSRWQELLAAALKRSVAGGGYLIVVEKFPPCCKLYRKGKLQKSFRAEFGPNWMGDKRCEGDNATPEGVYRVVKKKEGRGTRYDCALLLDYPNAGDRREFSRRKKSGELNAGAKIGSGIEIHGEGGKGAHWTNGCVALENRDMRQLYRYAGVGTETLIIGGVKPWRNSINYEYNGQ